MKKQLFLSLSFILFTSVLFGQRKYQIQEESVDLPIPFVKVKPDVGASFLSDLDGWFSVSDEVKSVQLSYADFMDTTVLLSDVIGNVILMRADVQQVEAVEVVAGENPAHRIMQIVIDRRRENDPLRNDAFTYKSYSKFKMDINQEALAAIPDSTTDSNLIDMRRFFGEQHLFMMESASKRTFVPPYRDKEEIIAYKVSGLNDPMFSTFANSFQSFSFYDNQIEIFGGQYINPIARGGLSQYLFILEDTTVVNLDTTFTIFYRPRLGKDFKGVTGRLYINTNGYAIEKAIASAYGGDTSGMQVKIIQEYVFTQNKKWFPSKLSTEFELKNFTIETIEGVPAYLQGDGSTYIEEVQINPEIELRGLNDNIVVQTSEDAAELDSTSWAKLRKYDITEKEERTYEVIDSLGKANNFDRFLKLAKILAEGKVPLGKYVNLDLMRLTRLNRFEGYRLGLGLETSRQLMKNIQLGGYFGWGTKDKLWKYGGFAQFDLNRKKGIGIRLRYQQDLLERGWQGFNTDLFSITTEGYRNFFINQMDQQRLGEISFSWDPKANIEMNVFGNYQRLWLSDDYSYLKIAGNELDVAEVGVDVTWNILEKYMLIGDRKVSLGKKYPQVRFRIAKGISNIFESELDYTRFNVEVSHTTPIRNLGKFKWKVQASKVVGEVPLTLTNHASGTRWDWNVSVDNTFETMFTGSFYTTSQVSLFTRFEFKAIKTKAKWNEPKFGLHHAFGFGNFDNRQDHAFTFETLEKGYFEAGLIFDGIITMQTLSVGLGGFYKYGSYADPDWKKNIVPKVVFSLKLD